MGFGKSYRLQDHPQFAEALDVWMPTRRRISMSAVPVLGGFATEGVGGFGPTPGGTSGTSTTVITQATDKSTGVTLSAISGLITMNNAALAAAAEVSFTVTNTLVAAGDTVVVNHASAGAAGSYLVGVSTVAAGSFVITVGNVSAGSLSEAIVLAVRVVPSSFLRHAVVVSGTPATSPNLSGDLASGAWSLSVTGTASGDSNKFATVAAVTRRSWNPWARFLFHAGSSATNVRWWVGLFSADPSAVAASGLGTGGITGACFSFDTGVHGSSAFWRCETAEGTTQQMTTTDMPVTASGVYTGEIRFDTTNGNVDFFMANHGLNSVAKTAMVPYKVATHGTTIPAASTALLAGGTVTTLTTAAKRLGLGQIVISQD